MPTAQPSEVEPTPLKLDQKTLTLWEKLRAAVDAEEDWLALQVEVRRLATRVDGLESARQRVLVTPLRAVAAEMQDLREVCEEHRERIRLTLQDLAWEFTAHAFNLQNGDRVRYTEGLPESISADRLLCVSYKLGDLALAGQLLKEDGSPGRKTIWISLLRTPWAKLPFGN
jgi:hypothetical protein